MALKSNLLILKIEDYVFSKLDEILQDGQIVNINLLKKNGRMYVSLVPKVQKMPDEAANKLIPLSVSGSAVELDQGFIETISQPVRERLGLVSNVDAFKKNTVSVAKSGSNTQSAAKKEHKPSKKEQLILEAETHEKNKRWPEAYQIYKKLSGGEPNDQNLKAKVMEIWDKMAQRPLFATPDTGENTSVGDEIDPDMEDAQEDVDNDTVDEVSEVDDTNQDDENLDVPIQNNPVNHIPVNPQKTEGKEDMFANIMSIMSR